MDRGASFGRLALFIALMHVASVGVSAAKIIPGTGDYGDFLVGEWKPNRPTVAVFKDPLCTYCIKGISKLKRLTDYNVFVFWSPVLGEASLKKVDDIFRCSSPVSEQVFEAVAARVSPDCTHERRDDLAELSRQITDNYKISAVPSYFIQGRQVSVAQLVNAQLKRPPVNGVVVEWDRFKAMKSRDSRGSKTLALVMPNVEAATARRLIASNESEYVFLGQDLAAGQSGLLPCHAAGQECDEAYLKLYRSRFLEFTMLLGLSQDTREAFVVHRDGALLPVSP